MVRRCISCGKTTLLGRKYCFKCRKIPKSERKGKNNWIPSLVMIIIMLIIIIAFLIFLLWAKTN